MRFDVISLFPDLIKNTFTYGVTGRALQNKKVILGTLNPRDFTTNFNGRIDDRPYGGGPGMIMQAEPMISAIKEAKKNTIFMSPQGKTFDQDKAIELSKAEHLIIVCGRYEGIDQRIIDTEIDEECSVGEYILSGGEIPALVIMDSVSRIIEGVVGDPDSVLNDTLVVDFLNTPSTQDQNPVNTEKFQKSY